MGEADGPGKLSRTMENSSRLRAARSTDIFPPTEQLRSFGVSERAAELEARVLMLANTSQLCV